MLDGSFVMLGVVANSASGSVRSPLVLSRSRVGCAVPSSGGRDRGGRAETPAEARQGTDSALGNPWHNSRITVARRTASLSTSTAGQIAPEANPVKFLSTPGHDQSQE